jgi:hypothetical protein
MTGTRARLAAAVTALTLPLAAGALAAAPAGAYDDPRGLFADSTEVDNRWYPLVPGTQVTLEGRAGDGGTLDHQVIFTVTDLVKVINGVPTVVLWDRDFSEGELIEAELAFHAQDDDGNVWNFGEYPEEFENGEFVGAPNAWIDGVDGAERGILFPGDPEVGTPAFVQGSAPDIDFLDVGVVSATDESTCVPAGCFEDVVVVDETSPLEPDSGHQLKYYGPGAGVVRIEAVGGVDPETLVLIDVAQLSPKELREVRAEALKLDRRAYRVSDVYRDTPRATVGEWDNDEGDDDDDTAEDRGGRDGDDDQDDDGRHDGGDDGNRDSPADAHLPQPNRSDALTSCDTSCWRWIAWAWHEEQARVWRWIAWAWHEDQTRAGRR